MAFEFGDVVLVPFPFTDQTTTKRPPSVIVSSAAYNRDRPDVIILAVTGHARPAAAIGAAAISAWRSAGPLKPSTLKPLLATIEKQLVVRSLVRLEPIDRATLREVLDTILGS